MKATGRVRRIEVFGLGITAPIFDPVIASAVYKSGCSSPFGKKHPPFFE